jgi:hypothetical protein
LVISTHIQAGQAHPVIEVTGESLEIHVHRVNMPVELRPRFGAHVPGGHRHHFDATLPAGIGHIDCVLQEDDRVVVGERDAAAAKIYRGSGDGFRRRRVGEGVGLA